MRPFVLVLLCFLFSLTAFADAPAPNRFPGFVQNKGQWASQILYTTDLPQGWLFLEKNGFTYGFYEPDFFHLEEQEEKGDAQRKYHLGQVEEGEAPRKYKGHGLKVEFLGGNPKAAITHHATLAERRHYFIGADRAQWATGVTTSQEVRYANLFPRVDLKFYAKGGKLKYDFVVRPGGQVPAVKMKYTGAEKLEIRNGKLYVKTSVNEFTEETPYAYQVVDGQQREVPCAFTLVNGVVGFKLTGRYNPALPLIIDPEIVFISYTGTTTSVSANCATADDQGNTYTAAQAMGPNYPVTAGAFQTVLQGTNLAISKFNPSGTQLLFATYFGGPGTSYPLGMLINKKNELVFCGTTTSKQLPVSPTAYNPIGPASFSDFFISKLNADGNDLLASTYLGGSQMEASIGSTVPAGLAEDKEGNVILASSTNSTDFPLVNPLQSQHKGFQDGFISKLDPSLSTLLWSTYVGGTLTDRFSDVKVGPSSGNIYLVGSTSSADFPVTSGTVNSTFLGTKDGFVLVVNPDESKMVAATFLGTFGNDLAQLLTLDEEENVYVAGYTSGSYPVTPGTFHTAGGAGGHFIHKLNNTLTTTYFSTHLGNSTLSIPEPIPTAFELDACGNIYLTAYSVPDSPVTPNAFYTVRRNLYLCQLSKDAKELVFGTFFGGTEFGHVHLANHSYISKKAVFYNIECAAIPTVIATPGAYSAGQTTSFDGIISKFRFDPPHLAAAGALTPPQGCAPYQVHFQNTSVNAISYSWDFGDGTPPSSEANPRHSFANPGNYRVRLIARSGLACFPSDTTYIQVLVKDAAPVTAAAATPLPSCVNYQVTFFNQSVNARTYLWDFGDGSPPVAVPNPTHTYQREGTFQVRLIAFNPESCNTSDTVFVTVKVMPVITVAAQVQPVPVGCAPYTVQFANLTGGNTSYTWNFKDGSPASTEENPTHTFQAPGRYQVQLTAKANTDCSVASTFTVEVEVLRMLVAPNIFTPNGDGKNDFFTIVNLGPRTKVKIYNRWGNLVFESDAYDNRWQGRGLAEGTYFYTAEAPDACQPIKGWVEILR